MSSNEHIIHVDRVKPHTSKKKRRRIIIVLVLLIAAAGGAYWYLNQSAQPEIMTISSYDAVNVTSGDLVSTTEASGTVVLPNQVTIVNTKEGYIKELLVAEGDEITTEDVLLVMDVPEYEEQMETYEVQLEQANIEYDSQVYSYDYQIAGYQKSIARVDEDITEAQADIEAITSRSLYDLRTLQLKIDRLTAQIETARADVTEAAALAELRTSYKTSYEAAVDTLDSLLESKEDYELQLADTYDSLYETALKDLKALQESKADYESDLANTQANREFYIAKQESNISQIQLNISQLKNDIQELNITSPIAGEILSINGDAEIEGNYLSSSESLFVVADRSQVYVDLDVYEQYAGLLEVGDPVSLTIGTETMSAEIIRIGKVASLDSDGLTATIAIRVRPQTDTVLNPGASAVSSITLGTQENTLLLPRGSYLTTGSQKYLYVVDGDKAYKTEVTFGEIQGNKVEVISGVEAGDTVITSSYQGFIAEDVIRLQ